MPTGSTSASPYEQWHISALFAQKTGAIYRNKCRQAGFLLYSAGFVLFLGALPDFSVRL